MLPGSHASVCKEESASGKGATTNSSVLPGEEYLMGMDKKWTEVGRGMQPSMYPTLYSLYVSRSWPGNVASKELALMSGQ